MRPAMSDDLVHTLSTLGFTRGGDRATSRSGALGPAPSAYAAPPDSVAPASSEVALRGLVLGLSAIDGSNSQQQPQEWWTDTGNSSMCDDTATKDGADVKTIKISMEKYFDKSFRYYFPAQHEELNEWNLLRLQARLSQQRQLPQERGDDDDEPGRQERGEEPNMGIKMLEIRMAITGRLILYGDVVEPMTCSQLKSCTHNMLAKELPAPRITLKLLFAPLRAASMTVRVTVGRLHSWVDERRPDYDERLDPMSDFWMDLDPGWDRCLLCGDFAIDVDELVDAREKRRAKCKRCEPCAVCDNCKVTSSTFAPMVLRS